LNFDEKVLLKMSGSRNFLKDLGLGILSWKGHTSLAASLKNYQDAGLLDLFSEKMVFLPEMDEDGRHLAEKYSLTSAGTTQNLGILGGFKAMAEAMSSKYLLLAENDYELSRESITQNECYETLSRGLDHLKSGQSCVWRFRDLHNPGQVMHHSKILKYWPNETSPPKLRFTSFILRMLRPNKAHRLKGMTVYTSKTPSQDFPNVIKQLSSGDYLVRSDVMNWANNLFLIDRDFFLNQIIPEAEKNIGGRLINGFPTIETELNRGTWWRESKFWIGVSNPGLFTHDRKGDRGYT
jgi:hypothetical protein